MKTKKIIIYDEPTVEEIKINEIEKFLKETFQVVVEIRPNFFENTSKEIFQKIATTRIFELKKPFEKHNPTDQEIQMEENNIDNSQNEEKILYDGFEFQKIIAEFITSKESNQETLHIIFTNKLACTFDESDYRYHARALIGSNPTIISTTGIIEAPAKPRQYYLDLMTDFKKERINQIKEKYKEEFLEYNDSRISEIVKGYLLQAIMYYETGEAFCEDKECRLYNAHWQKDLIYSQLKNRTLCNKHQEKLQKIVSH
ncbi:DUF6775 family putative metallopeptidase [Nitrosopumilus sp. b2]|uniref:DUF6775 family putative metallopeptidase n=1 Tax=Nitrosopumilus sp. b2 TaxID=2109908 RepID=UPI0015F67CCD|nr:DUF6775 family putative metallopeptidase [Nitrosopumilus sp. b2]KAF6244716.1 hypothetical protein C6989_07000 [Nitrosopumilus sp. b2]